jgi:hypothetical protein
LSSNIVQHNEHSIGILDSFVFTVLLPSVCMGGYIPDGYQKKIKNIYFHLIFVWGRVINFMTSDRSL